LVYPPYISPISPLYLPYISPISPATWCAAAFRCLRIWCCLVRVRLGVRLRVRDRVRVTAEG
jgi:hypothetical protein